MPPVIMSGSASHVAGRRAAFAKALAEKGLTPAMDGAYEAELEDLLPKPIEVVATARRSTTASRSR
jgi:hypothetical protein